MAIRLEDLKVSEHDAVMLLSQANLLRRTLEAREVEARERLGALARKGADLPKYPPNQEYSEFRGLIKEFLDELGKSKPDFIQAFNLALSIQKRRAFVIGKKALPTLTNFPGIAEILKNGADLGKDYVDGVYSNRKIEITQKVDAQKLDAPVALVDGVYFFASELSAKDSSMTNEEAFSRDYLQLKMFRGLHHDQMLASKVPQDNSLKECVDLALALTEDYLHGHESSLLDVRGTKTDIAEQAAKVGGEGGDLTVFPYSYFKVAEDLVNSLGVQLTSGVLANDNLKEKCGFYEYPAPQQVNETRKIQSHIKKIIGPS